MSFHRPKEKITWTIDKARHGDGKGIEQVRKAAWLVTYPDPRIDFTVEDILTVAFDTPEKLEKWDRMIESQGNTKRIWVVREESKIVGFAVAERTEAKHELNAIYILPTYKGQGVGSALMTDVLEWLGGDRDVVVWVFSHNESAIQFYRKHGFQETGKTAFLVINGKKIPDLEMVHRRKAQNSPLT